MGELRRQNRQNLVVILVRAIVARGGIIPDMIGNNAGEEGIGIGMTMSVIDIDDITTDTDVLCHQSTTGRMFQMNITIIYRDTFAIYTRNIIG